MFALHYLFWWQCPLCLFVLLDKEHNWTCLSCLKICHPKGSIAFFMAEWGKADCLRKNVTSLLNNNLARWMECFHLLKIQCKAFGEWRLNLKGDWISTPFKRTNCYFVTLALHHYPVAGHCAPQCFTELSLKPVRSKLKPRKSLQCCFYALLLLWKSHPVLIKLPL